MSQYRLLQLFLMSAASVAALSDCYYPNGTAIALSAAYQPCISTANIFSMCCVLNVTALVDLGSSSASLDTCLPNGMCQPPASVGGFTRDLCTDPTWKSPNCLNICVGGSDGGSPDDTTFLTQCTDGSWCCGAKNTACCNNNQGFAVAKAISPYAVASSSTSAGSSPTSSGTSSPTQNTQASTSTPPKKTSSSSGAEIGLGAALGVILLAVVAVGIFLFVKKRRGNRGLVELGAGDSKAAFPMTPIQGGGHGVNQYGQEQLRGYQAPQQHVQNQQSSNGGSGLGISQQQGYGPGRLYAVEMDGNGGKNGGRI